MRKFAADVELTRLHFLKTFSALTLSLPQPASSLPPTAIDHFPAN